MSFAVDRRSASWSVRGRARRTSRRPSSQVDGLIPERYATTTPTGRPTLDKRTQTTRHEIYGAVLVRDGDRRGALAAAPGQVPARSSGVDGGQPTLATGICRVRCAQSRGAQGAKAHG